MNKITLDYCHSGISSARILESEEAVEAIREKLMDTDKNKHLGWLRSPQEWSNSIELFGQLAKKINDQSSAVVVLGIGGSYLGAKAIIEALKPSMGKGGPEVYFAGTNLNADYLSSIIGEVKDKDFCVIMISKSGTTLEPAVAFRIFRKLLKDKYGKKYNERIYAITDQYGGTLREMAKKNSYFTLPVPDDIGGRYSVLTPVGLLPLAVAGVDVKSLLDGAIETQKHQEDADITKNISLQYAVARNLLLKGGKSIEILVNYNPSLSYLSEWWKQLFAESEGKGGKGIFTASVNNTTDLHSMGQYIQDGPRHLFETVLRVDKSTRDIAIPDSGDEDGLDYLAGKSLDDLNQTAFAATLRAHVDGGVPNLVFNIPELSAYSLGALVQTFEYACAVSGYMLGVNPFDQPGVEEYKKHMFAALKKT